MSKHRVYPSAALNRKYKKNAEKKRREFEKVQEAAKRKVYCYLRVSTDMQNVESQKIGVKELAKRKQLIVDEYVIDDGISGTVKAENRNLGKLLNKLKKNDILICSELSRLSRSMVELLSLLNKALKTGVKIYSVKENYELGDDITSQVIAFAFSLCADIERRMISARTKEGLANAKAKGKVLGRPKGYVCKHHVTDGKKYKYLKLRLLGFSKIKIAKRFRISYKTIQNWVKRNKLDDYLKHVKVKTNYNKFDLFALSLINHI